MQQPWRSLTLPSLPPILKPMEMHLTPYVQAQLEQFIANTGCQADTLINDLLARHFEQRSRVRLTLNRRFDDIESGRVALIDGETVFERLLNKYSDTTPA